MSDAQLATTVIFFSARYKSRALWAKKQKTNTDVEYLGDICFKLIKKIGGKMWEATREKLSTFFSL